jgi:HrpA-like RNA helicase
MLVYAAMLQCTDPLLTIAAALGYGRPVFLSPLHARAEANAARARIAGPTNAAKSDHVALVYAFNQFRRKHLTDGASAARRWCIESFVSFDAMDAVQNSRADFANCLAELGFITLGAFSCH